MTPARPSRTPAVSIHSNLLSGAVVNARRAHAPSDSSFRKPSVSPLVSASCSPHAVPSAAPHVEHVLFPSSFLALTQLTCSRASLFASLRLRVLRSHASAAGDEYLGAGGASGLGAVRV